MHAMRRGSETFLKAIFGKSNEQKEEPTWGWLCDADRQLNGAEARNCLVLFLFFFFFIKENDLGTAERRSNMAKRREMPRRGERRAKECKGLNLKECSLGPWRREAAPSSQKTWVGILTLTRSCLPLGLSFHIDLFVYASQLRLKHRWR